MAAVHAVQHEGLSELPLASLYMWCQCECNPQISINLCTVTCFQTQFKFILHSENRVYCKNKLVRANTLYISYTLHFLLLYLTWALESHYCHLLGHQFWWVWHLWWWSCLHHTKEMWHKSVLWWNHLALRTKKGNPKDKLIVLQLVHCGSISPSFPPSLSMHSQVMTGYTSKVVLSATVPDDLPSVLDIYPKIYQSISVRKENTSSEHIHMWELFHLLKTTNASWT